MSFARTLEKIGHPLFLVGALALWWYLGQGDVAVMVAMAASLLAMEVLERIAPAKRAWRQTSLEKLKLVGVYAVNIASFGLIIGAYEAYLIPSLIGIREALGGAWWPTGWPDAMQILLLFFAGDFIYYWIHRAIHRWGPLWRASGHGLHHAFQNLHAINVGANHPLEVVWIALPAVLLGALGGAPSEVVAGATVLSVVNTTLAHSNLSFDTPLLNWFITSSNQHRRHHSVVFEQSNTNFACNAIVWDRLFGTYSDDEVEQTGIGARQPAIWEMYLLPIREPSDADTVAARQTRQ